MTGPEHYREAEKLLGYAEDLPAEERGSKDDMSFLAEAQVHATLALAAATRDAGIPRGKVFVDQCDIAESAYGRQCGKAMHHPGDCDFAAGGGA